MSETKSFPNIVAFGRTLAGYPDHVVAAFAVEASERIEALTRALEKIRAGLSGYEYLHSSVALAAIEARQALSSKDKTDG